MKKTVFLVLIGSAALFAGTPGVTLAEEEAQPSATRPDRGGLEEVVVTAQRREERLQDAPIAITALKASDLQARSADDITSLSAAVPNLNATVGLSGGNYANFYLRGVGQGNQDASTDPGVALYVDGVYLARTNGADLGTLDIAQIEVLRGPQGTLFGKNALGGAVSITTVQPGPTLGGSTELIVGSRNHLATRSSVNVPISDTLEARVSLNTNQQDGYGYRITDGQRFGDVHQVSTRGAVKWTPIDDLTVTLAGDYSHYGGNSPLVKLEGIGVNGLLPPSYTQYVSQQKYGTFAGYDQDQRLYVRGTALTTEWRLDPGLTLKSITAYRSLRQQSGNDFDAGPVSYIDEGFDTRQQQFSEELQAGGKALDDRLNYLVGVYYFKEIVDQAIPLFAFTPVAFDQVARYNTKNLSVFTQETFHLNDVFSITGGYRYTHEKKSVRAEVYNLATYDAFYTLGVDDMIDTPAALRGATLAAPTLLEKSWNSGTPKLSIDAKINPEMLLYLSYSKGFKSGGFNARESGSESFASFDPETLDTYELGAKMQFLDDKVRLNLAGFWSHYNNLQLYVVRITPSGALVIDNQNAAKDRLFGFEGELTVTPAQGLVINSSVGYLNNKYEQLDAQAIAAGINYGNQLPQAPKYSANIGAQYTYALQNQTDLTLRMDYSYKSKYYSFAANNPLDVQPAFGLLNARVSYVMPEGITLAAFVKNLTNKYYFNMREDVRNSYDVALSWPAEPRTWGMEIGYKF